MRPHSDTLAPACFFLVSVGYKVAWTAISSLLTQYGRDYGPHILLYLNVAYFFPSIPILFIQSYITDGLEKRLGTQVATLLRFFLGFGSLITLTAGLPFWATSEHKLLLITVFIGMSYGLAFGTSYQLVSKFPRENTVALTTGFVSCGPVVLLFDLLLKRGPYYTPSTLKHLFLLVSGQTAMGLLAACALVAWHWKALGLRGPRTVIAPLAPRPSKRAPFHPQHSLPTPYHRLRLRTEATEKPMSPPQALPPDSPDTTIDMSNLLASTGSPPSSLNGLDDPSAPLLPPARGKGADKAALPLLRLLRRMAPAATALAASVGTSMLVFPFFTYVRSTGLLGEHLPQVLFYVRLLADIAGRLVPSTLQARTPRQLMFWTLVKLALTPLLLLSIFFPHVTMGDLGAVVLVAFFWVLSGYLNTCAYLMAPQLVPPVQSSKVGGLMASIFQCACFTALVAAFLLQQIHVPRWLSS